VGGGGMNLKSFAKAMRFSHLAFCVLFWLPALFFFWVAYGDYNFRGCYNEDGNHCGEAFGAMMIASFVLAGPFFHLFHRMFRTGLKGTADA
jgi:4-hydroxybenzoate polyprenyltransferase